MQIKYNNKIMEFNETITPFEIFKEKNEQLILAARYNNEIKGLDYKIEKDGEIEEVTYEDVDGKRIYVRGVMFIMSKALKELYPEALVTINYQLTSAMFCELENIEITDEFITKLKQKMLEIVKRDLPIKKVVMTKEQAEEFYNNEKSTRGKLQLESKVRSIVSLYFCEDYYNYFFGVMPISTGYIKTFDLLKYKDGFLVRYPGKESAEKLIEYKENKKLFITLNEYEDIHKILNINTVYKLNNIVRDNKITEHILLDEALHEKKIANIADKIKQNPKIKVILIAGPSSSGKTTFAKRLGMQLKINGLKPVTISVDNYFVEREQNPKDENGNYDFECIEAIDTQLLNDDITKLLNGEEIQVPTFNFKMGAKEYTGETMKLNNDEVLVLEGIHCLNDNLTKDIPQEKKYKIYISALTVLNIDYYNRISTTDTRIIRRIVRDNQFRNYSALHTLQMWYSIKRGEERNIFPYQEEADSMFNTSLIYELGVLKDYAMPLLAQIDNTHKEYSEAKRLYTLLSYFESIKPDKIPEISLLREFIGGSVFYE